jgi:hypothetical protein
LLGYNLFTEATTDYADIIAWVKQMALQESDASSDALYHNVEHAICNNLAGRKKSCGENTSS